MQKSIFILFGATGDLSKQKILPILDKTDVTAILYVRKAIESKFTSVVGNLNNLQPLVEYLKNKTYQEFYFYLALPPDLYISTIQSINKYFAKKNYCIALEKPFGISLDDAKELAKIIKKIGSRKFYIIDHYLAKEVLINNKKLNLKNIKNIKIALLEKDTVEKRGNFYDKVGAIKDVGQNHMLNILSKFIGPLNKIHYKRGTLKLGQYKGYLNTKGVNKNSQTETYFKASFGLKGTNINIEFEAGKAQKENLVYLEANYTNGTKYKIQIKPTKTPVLKEAHWYIIEDILNKKKNFAVSVEKSLLNWKIVEEILQDKSKTKIEKY